ncbi:MAG: DUF1592 domain-containing protein [Planctomycetota bacterium]
MSATACTTSRLRQTAWLTVPLIFCAALVLPRFLASGTRLASAAWQQEHSRRLRDPLLRRCYLFTGDDAHLRSRNLAAWHGELTAAEAGEGRVPRRVAGREDALRAVRLEDIPMQAMPVIVDRQFTVEFRIRHHGQGFVVGGNARHSGTLAAMGDGIWNGFLFSLQFPSNTLSFQLGRPKPDPALPVTAISRIPAGVWSHLAGTWDGREVRIYVNGLLAGRRQCAGPLIPVPRTSRLRLGYVGNGLGCVRFDVEHFAMSARCLSDAEILQTAWPTVSGSSPQGAALLQSGRLLVAGEPSLAAAQLRNLSGVMADSPLRALAEFRLGECDRERGRIADAVRWFTAASATSRPDSIRGAATTELQSLKDGTQPPSSMTARQDRAGQQAAVAAGESQQMKLLHSDRTAQLQLAMAEANAWRDRFNGRVQPILQTACCPCHSGPQAAGPDLKSIRTAEDAVSAGARFWQRVATVVREEAMPPQHSIHLAAADRQRLLHWLDSRPRKGLCEEIPEDADEPRYFEEVGWRIGFAAARRLTRRELRNAVRDLLGVVLTDDQLPPPEGSGGEGFDTSSATLFTSSSLLESWLQSVHDAVDQAIAADTAMESVESRRLLRKAPTSAVTVHEAARGCLEPWMRRAWRRQPTLAELDRLLPLVDTAFQEHGSFAAAVGEAAKAILLSPAFLLVAEPERGVDGDYPLLPEQLATRMSLFLWSSIPDDELLHAALHGRLDRPQEIREQIRRMLMDPRSNALGESFGLQWLGLDRPENLQPDRGQFPEWTPELAALLLEEASRFTGFVLREDRPLTELLEADYVMANGQLAAFYGLPGDEDRDWERVQIQGGSRGGVLSLAAVLTATSRPHRTSPVLRGRWILETILGETVPPAPPDIPVLPEETDPDAPLTLRERLEQHRSDPGCAACHQTMDQLGFALEQFGPTGRLRSHDGTGLVDATGLLPSGERIQGLAGLRQALKARHREFLRLFCRRLLGYALGRELERFDLCVVDRCLERLEASGNRSSAVIEEIILSYPFRNRQAIR